MIGLSRAERFDLAILRQIWDKRRREFLIGSKLRADQMVDDHLLVIQNGAYVPTRAGIEYLERLREKCGQAKKK